MKVALNDGIHERSQNNSRVDKTHKIFYNTHILRFRWPLWYSNSLKQTNTSTKALRSKRREGRPLDRNVSFRESHFGRNVENCFCLFQAAFIPHLKTIHGPVVQSLVSANTGLYFNPLFWFMRFFLHRCPLRNFAK